jgi:hypothetical protein
MSMIDVFRSLGRSDALKLREEAHSLTGTQIIAQEHATPAFDPQHDYSAWPVGSPVTDEGQVWLLIQPYNASNHPGTRPSTLRALWGLAHTKDPKRAKPWVEPYGTSGMYMQGECYRDAAGVVWKAKNDNTVFDAVMYPDGWTEVLL